MKRPEQREPAPAIAPSPMLPILPMWPLRQRVAVMARTRRIGISPFEPMEPRHGR